MYDYAVIGIGLIGSAAVKYLSLTGKKVVGIGPAEPNEPWQDHDGIFGSHYDQGRITRQLDGRKLWAELAIKSIAEYAHIEQKSGIRFYTQAGCLQVGPETEDKENYFKRTARVAHSLNTPFLKFTAEEFQQKFPELHFDPDHTFFHEETIAGYINPRDLVDAQLKITEMEGGHLLRETAVSFKKQNGHYLITTKEGSEIKANKVIIAAGAWTHYLLGKSLDFIPKPRTIIMARLDEKEAHRLRNVPSIIYTGEMLNPAIDGFYSLPPILYPDGHVYFKIGAGLKELDIPKDADELNEWFKGEGSKLEADGLKEELFRFIKEFKPQSMYAKPCVVTFRESMEPLLEELEPNLFIAAGGCGAAAKSSNEIGRLAAQMAIDKD